MARTLGITYGTLIVGAAESNASIKLHDKYSLEWADDEIRLVFRVRVRTATSAALITAETVLLTAMRLPDQKLEVKLAGGTRHTFDPAANTGFLTRARARKAGTRSDTAFSSDWLCIVTAKLPHDFTGREGRERALIRLSKDASERRIAVFRGSYTALAGNSAVAQYTAAVDTYINGELTGLGGSWNPIKRTYEYEDRNKLLTFDHEYEEILLAESGAGLDESALVLQQLDVGRAELGDARSVAFPDVRPLELVVIEYSVSVRNSVSTSLEALYTGTILPHILKQAGGDVIIRRAEPRYDKANNRIRVSIVGFATRSGVLSASRSVSHLNEFGEQFVPVWDGGQYTARIYPGKARAVAEVVLQLAYTPGATFSLVNAVPEHLRGLNSKWRLVSMQDTGPEEVVFGAPSGGGEFRIVTLTQRLLYERVDPPNAAGASAGAGDAPVTGGGGAGGDDFSGRVGRLFNGDGEFSPGF